MHADLNTRPEPATLTDAFEASENVPKETAALEGPRAPSPDRTPTREYADYDDGLLPVAGPVMLLAYLITLLIAAFTFWNSRATLLSVAVCAAYIAMYFGVPYIMARVRNAHDTRWRSDTSERSNDEVQIFGGSIRRSEALLQMVIVPVCVVFAFAAFSVIWLWQAP